jgi:thioredoxin 1
MEFDEENFEAEVLGSTVPVLVEFGAPWCAPCQQQAPILKKFAEENESVKVGIINVDKSRPLANKYGVKGVPTLIVFNNGNKVKSKVGLVAIDNLQSLVG